jgi:prophage antirepressor-like protein
MTALIPFEYSGRQVRTVQVDGEPWFVAADVCAVLELNNVTMAVASLDEDEKGFSTIETPGGEQRVVIVNEPGLYSLILRSRKPEAKAFKRWLTHEVIPALRKRGRYDVPADFATALELAAKQAREIEAQRAELSIVKPQAEAWTTLADTGADYSVREAAYILNRDPSIETGQIRLFGLLKDWRLIGADKRPYATHAKHVTLRPQTRRLSSGERVPAAPQVRVTVEGLAYLHKRMGGTAPLDTSGLDGAA